MHRIAATFAMLVFAQFVCAAPFQNGSFEAGFPITSPEPCFVTLPSGSTNLTGWTVIVGSAGAGTTVSVAGSLVTLPDLLLTATRNVAPFSATVIAGVTDENVLRSCGSGAFAC